MWENTPTLNSVHIRRESINWPVRTTQSFPKMNFPHFHEVNLGFRQSGVLTSESINRNLWARVLCYLQSCATRPAPHRRQSLHSIRQQWLHGMETARETGTQACFSFRWMERGTSLTYVLKIIIVLFLGMIFLCYRRHLICIQSNLSSLEMPHCGREFWGWCDGSVGKGICCPAWQSESNVWSHVEGANRLWNAVLWPPMCAWHSHLHTHTH